MRAARVAAALKNPPACPCGQGNVIVPEAVMIEPPSAFVFTRPVPLPVTPSKAPVPLTIVCEISKKIGANSAVTPVLRGTPRSCHNLMRTWTRKKRQSKAEIGKKHG